MNEEAYSLARRLLDGEGSDRALDAEVYAFLQRNHSPFDSISDARPSENHIGLVVVYRTNGGHGTCNAPRYTTSIGELPTAYALYGKGKEPETIPFDARKATADFLKRICR